MPLPRFERLDPARRQGLLAAAAAEFAAHGFEGASTNRIVEAAGVSKGAVYYYFEDKADLYAAVLASAFDDLAERLGDPGRVADAADFWRRGSALLRRALAIFAAEPELVALARGLYRAPPGAASLGAMVERSHAWLARTLETGRKLGAVRDDVPADLLAVAATGMCMGMDRWLAEHWEDLEPQALAALEGQVLGLLRSLVEPREETP